MFVLNEKWASNTLANLGGTAEISLSSLVKKARGERLIFFIHGLTTKETLQCADF